MNGLVRVGGITRWSSRGNETCPTKVAGYPSAHPSGSPLRIIIRLFGLSVPGTLYRGATMSITSRILLALALTLTAVPAHASAQVRPDILEPEDANEARLNALQPPGQVMDAIGLGPGMMVAEIGAGRGRYVVQLAVRVGAQGRVYAEDIDRAALNHCADRCARGGLENVETVVGDLTDPRLPPTTLDMVFVISSYHHFSDPVTLMRNARTALKPGGTLAIVEWLPRDENDTSYGTPAQMAAQLEEAGFELVRTDPCLEANRLMIYIFRPDDEGPLANAPPAGDGPIRPGLVFRSEAFGAARDFTFDAEGDLFFFDYLDNMIRKFDPIGRELLSFGGNGEAGGPFTHLMEIEVFGDRLIALDSVARFTFDLEGRLLDRQGFGDEIVCEQPVVSRDGTFVGERLADPEAKDILTYRDDEGGEIARLESYDLSDLIPAIRPGVDFFLDMNHMRSYRYGYLADGAPVWATTDTFRVLTLRDGRARELITGSYTPVAVPVEERADMQARSASLPAPLFMYVPEHYRLIHKLFVGMDGDIWIYVQSVERTGLLRYTAQGREKAFYALEAGFDVGDEDVVIREYRGDIWFMVPARGEVAVYRAVIGE
jgi:SAM-dependent methyltransferase